MPVRKTVRIIAAMRISAEHDPKALESAILPNRESQDPDGAPDDFAAYILKLKSDAPASDTPEQRLPTPKALLDGTIRRGKSKAS